MRLNENSIGEAAQRIQEERLSKFAANALAAAGGKFDLLSFTKQAKRIEKNWRSSAPVQIADANGLFANASGSVDIGNDRFALVGKMFISINAVGISIPDGVMQQIAEKLKIKIKRRNGSSVEQSAHAFLVGAPMSNQGGYTDDDAFASQVIPLEAYATDGGFEVPLDVLNFNDDFEFEFVNLSAAGVESWTDLTYATVHILCAEAVKG